MRRLEEKNPMDIVQLDFTIRHFPLLHKIESVALLGTRYRIGNKL